MRCREHRFSLSLQSEWENDTVYQLHGPTENGLQHTIQINVEPDVNYGTVADYASPRVKQRQSMLQNGRLIEKTLATLDNDLPAYHALFLLSSSEEADRYLKEMYVLHKTIGYRLSAQLTGRTHASIGKTVNQIFRSFKPRLPLQHRR